jgi:hypothetical protein
MKMLVQVSPWEKNYSELYLANKRGHAISPQNSILDMLHSTTDVHLPVALQSSVMLKPQPVPHS